MPPKHSFQSFIKGWCYCPHVSDKGTDVQKAEVASPQRIKAVSCLNLSKHQTAMWGGFCRSFHCQAYYLSFPFPLHSASSCYGGGLRFVVTEAWLSHVEGEWKWQVSLLSRSFEIPCLFYHLSFFFAIRLTMSQIEAVQSTWGSKKNSEESHSYAWAHISPEIWGTFVTQSNLA